MVEIKVVDGHGQQVPIVIPDGGNPDATIIAWAISMGRTIARAVEATPSSTKAQREMAELMIGAADEAQAALKRMEHPIPPHIEAQMEQARRTSGAPEVTTWSDPGTDPREDIGRAVAAMNMDGAGRMPNTMFIASEVDFELRLPRGRLLDPIRRFWLRLRTPRGQR